MRHIGYAYDLSHLTTTNGTRRQIRRFICAFNGDLAKSTAAHQLRWKIHQLTSTSAVRPHPSWWDQQMGRWPDGVGPFERFFAEMEVLNQLHLNVYKEPLLRTTTRPREFGWILRPSRQEFDAFTVILDKLLSDNLRSKALDEMGIPQRDENDDPIGTIRRLDMFLEKKGVDEAGRKAVLKPFRDVRRSRQDPAHSIIENITDDSFIDDQAELLQAVTRSVFELRSFWKTHPRNRAVEDLDLGEAYYL
jgi:hypothetical protein